MFPKAITLVTLGVADLGRARAFYAALGWEAAEVGEGVVFIQLAGQVLALFGIDDLAKDMGAERAGLGTGAATLARNFASEAEVDAAFELAVGAGATGAEAAGEGVLGRVFGVFRGPGRACLGGGDEPVLAAGGGRHADAAGGLRRLAGRVGFP